MKAKRYSQKLRLAIALGVVLGAVLVFLTIAGLQVQIAAADCENVLSVTGCASAPISDTNTEASDWYQRHNSFRSSATSAEQDLRMVMQELERERLDQLNPNSSAVPSRATNASAEQDMRMVMQELERERFDQLYAKSFDAASISCLDSRVSCDR